MRSGAVTIRDASGAAFEAELVEERPDGSLVLRTSEGRRLDVPAEGVARREGRDVVLASRLEGTAATHSEARPGSGEGPSDGDRRAIPIVQEEAVVQKRPGPTSTVRVTTRTQEHEEEVGDVLVSERVDVERVPIDRYVDEPATVREEDGTTIVPLHEEVLVVEKRLLLREELHIRTRQEEREEFRRVSLRRQDADIQRTRPDEA